MIHYLPFILLVIIPCEIDPWWEEGSSVRRHMCEMSGYPYWYFYFPSLSLGFHYFLFRIFFFFFRKLPPARNPFKTLSELVMCMANSEFVLSLPCAGPHWSSSSFPVSWRCQRQQWSKLPGQFCHLAVISLANPLILPCLSFLIHDMWIAAAFLLHAVLRNRCFIFAFCQNTSDS